MNNKLIRVGIGQPIADEKLIAVNVAFWDHAKSLRAAAKFAGIGPVRAERVVFSTRKEWEEWKQKKQISN